MNILGAAVATGKPANHSVIREFNVYVNFFLVAKLLYKSKCPSACLSTTFRGKRDFLGP